MPMKTVYRNRAAADYVHSRPAYSHDDTELMEWHRKMLQRVVDMRCSGPGYSTTDTTTSRASARP